MLTRLMDISVIAKMDTVECAVTLVSTPPIYGCSSLTVNHVLFGHFGPIYKN